MKDGFFGEWIHNTCTYDGYKKWSPRGIIMVGIAYGKHKNIAKIVKAEKAKGMIRR